MTTFVSVVREYQVRCLLRAQDNLAKARASGFDLPDDVALGVQEIMTKIPALIKRLEEGAPATEADTEAPSAERAQSDAVEVEAG